MRSILIDWRIAIKSVLVSNRFTISTDAFALLRHLSRKWADVVGVSLIGRDFSGSSGNRATFRID